MFAIDVRSIILFAGAMAVLMGTVLFFLRRSYPPTVQGLNEWAAAPFVLLVASVLFGARGVVPDVLSILLANLLLFCGGCLFYFGSRRFFGLEPSYRLWGGIAAALTPVIAWYALVDPHHGHRITVVSGYMASLMFAHCQLILRQGQRRFSHYFTAAALLAVSVTQSVRFVTSFSLSAADGIFDSTSPMQVVYVAVYAFAMLTVSIGVILMATDKLRGELEYLATHDTLTAVLNRRATLELLERELARSRRHGHVLSVLMMDLDHFKAINDNHGHLVGDRVIADFAARVNAVLRRPDRLGRYGGEEFLVLLPETGREAAAVVAERIRASVTTAEGVPAYTVSIGVATNLVTDVGIDQIVSRADKALYQAKHGGRNRVMQAPALQEIA